MFIGHDQYGNHYNLKKHPRKELCEQLNSKHASKMYIHRSNEIYHIGYIILGHWIEVFGLEGITFATKQ